MRLIVRRQSRVVYGVAVQTLCRRANTPKAVGVSRRVQFRVLDSISSQP